jgi:hypothetical protein
MKLVKDDNQAIKVPLQDGSMINTMPSETVFLPVNVDQVKKSGIVPKDMDQFLTDQISWNVGKGGIMKPELIQLDIIAQNAAEG